jgi:hypothetical protein
MLCTALNNLKRDVVLHHTKYLSMLHIYILAGVKRGANFAAAKINWRLFCTHEITTIYSLHDVIYWKLKYRILLFLKRRYRRSRLFAVVALIQPKWLPLSFLWRVGFFYISYSLGECGVDRGINFNDKKLVGLL